MSDWVVETAGLRKEYRNRKGKSVAVDDLSLLVSRGASRRIDASAPWARAPST